MYALHYLSRCIETARSVPIFIIAIDRIPRQRTCWTKGPCPKRSHCFQRLYVLHRRIYSQLVMDVLSITHGTDKIVRYC